MESPKLGNIDSGNLSSILEANELEENGSQRISVAHQVNGSDYTSHNKADSFIVDMEHFSAHLNDNDVSSNSRNALQRSLSRKGLQRGGEKRTNSSINNERDNNAVTTSPRAAFHGASTPEKSMVVTVGATDHSLSPKFHNAITIMTGTGTATAAESKIGGRRFSFRRSSSSWTIDPRRILFFFATISSMGTILLIYFTLSMGKLNGDSNGLD